MTQVPPQLLAALQPADQHPAGTPANDAPALNTSGYTPSGFALVEATAGSAVTAAAFHNDILAATLAGAAAGFAVNRDPGTGPPGLRRIPSTDHIACGIDGATIGSGDAWF